MKITETTDKPTREDATKFPFIIENANGTYTKVFGGTKQALYTLMDKEKKLKGFYLASGTNTMKLVELADVALERTTTNGKPDVTITVKERKALHKRSRVRRKAKTTKH